uniref:Ig-like domain-containing protein n=1 Tax=Pygocentrus nattereri TaxID=42514 RepID=A0AAR2M4U0_PYGNA
MFTLIITLCLFTTVNTDTSELQVQTVRSGSNVTIKCGHKMDSDSKTVFLAWYKQSLGKVPEYVVRSFGDERKPRFTQSFSKERFTLDEEASGLIINGIKEEDAGTYFCGKVKQNFVEFDSGTLLLFEAVKTDQHPVTEMVIKTGDSVTLQCSVESLTPDCSGDHSVYWFRHGSGESHPGIIYTHGNRSDECEKSSETDSPTQSCVYKLPTRNLSLSDAGTYYCAVAACGQILFGDQTKVTVQGESNDRIELLFCVEISLCGDFFEQFLFII